MLSKEKLEVLYKDFNSYQTAGIDGTDKNTFDKNLTQEIDTIVRKVSNDSYDFSYYKQKLLVKSTNKTREISIPTLRDKLLLKYLSSYLLDTFYDSKIQKPSIKTMIKDIKESKAQYSSYLKLDIQTFFPTINHAILMKTLAIKIKDKKILELIQKAITQTTVDISTPSKQRVKYNNKIGIPQGLSISGILADIYLEVLDKKYTNNKKIKYYRFVDDILILSKHKDIKGLAKRVSNNFAKLKLSTHAFKKDSNKSSFGDIQSKFDFLGYVFDGDIVSVRESSIQKLYQNINKLFTQYKQNKISTKKQLYTSVNFKIVGCEIKGKRYGWLNFFSHLNDHSILYNLDAFIEKNCDKYDLKYNKLKKFSRAIFEMKNPNSKYMKVTSSLYKINPVILEIDLKDDVEFY
ncbi:reverse transcriptase domain-containing protein [Poseidonibacter antarcticus]|uniref:reverse transcriptase domain-containing protein n=1 Tax=Poseidonibacter antarcticus TaxID=2478538 RepID=UPI000EF4CB90|nr:reverse transcriptase domain-containing protein [Poseidonibacter antarcticus]